MAFELEIKIFAFGYFENILTLKARQSLNNQRLQKAKKNFEVLYFFVYP
ncbi:hypothetical protein Cabys_2778 [Caldithrix abyssi DSM 13497]|uniref:Uncharacterized protein n=1 Tax=Caldithrix abyssi DSM 13497 TaxID=880073 RepID=A0A1J1CAH0_CALAY|nr:hypothetical protein Cabys_2778 [Caldithrix abyssi DSM 13497]